MTNLESRIEEALAVLIRYGQIDDPQLVVPPINLAMRCLTGCPKVTGQAKDSRGVEYEYDKLGESEEYKQLIAEACSGEDGPDTYGWDIGTPP